jgi:hypothetical protein
MAVQNRRRQPVDMDRRATAYRSRRIVKNDVRGVDLARLPGLCSGSMRISRLSTVALFFTMSLAGCAADKGSRSQCANECMLQPDAAEAAACMSECVAAWPKGANEEPGDDES